MTNNTIFSLHGFHSLAVCYKKPTTQSVMFLHGASYGGVLIWNPGYNQKILLLKVSVHQLHWPSRDGNRLSCCHRWQWHWLGPSATAEEGRFTWWHCVLARVPAASLEGQQLASPGAMGLLKRDYLVHWPPISMSLLNQCINDLHTTVYSRFTWLIQ